MFRQVFADSVLVLHVLQTTEEESAVLTGWAWMGGNVPAGTHTYTYTLCALPVIQVLAETQTQLDSLSS